MSLYDAVTLLDWSNETTLLDLSGGDPPEPSPNDPPPIEVPPASPSPSPTPVPQA